MSLLFSPLQIRSVNFKNRLVVSPMCQYSSIDGFANNWHLVHLGSRAVGGAGLVFTEAIAVQPEGRITPSDLGIWKDEHILFLKQITDFIKQQGSVAGTQLAHAGRKASHAVPWEGGKPLQTSEAGWMTQSPSAIKYAAEDSMPHHLNLPEIKIIIENFITAASRAIEAGFEVIEIHAAHGYLINQFLCDSSNNREDEYGGSFENRIRILREITQGIRKVIGEQFPLFVRISATEWIEGGWSIEDSMNLSKLLKDDGADLIDCSSGGNNRKQKIEAKPLFQVHLAEAVKNNAFIMTGAVGLITTAEEAEKILEDKQADLIFIGREYLREPYFTLKAAEILKEPVEWPPQYERGRK